MKKPHLIASEKRALSQQEYRENIKKTRTEKRKRAGTGKNKNNPRGLAEITEMITEEDRLSDHDLGDEQIMFTDGSQKDG